MGVNVTSASSTFKLKDIKLINFNFSLFFSDVLFYINPDHINMSYIHIKLTYIYTIYILYNNIILCSLISTKHLI